MPAVVIVFSRTAVGVLTSVGLQNSFERRVIIMTMRCSEGLHA